MTTNITENTKWRVIDSHWCCVYRKYIQDNTEVEMTEYCKTLADYLWMIGFDIPESIKYCIAENGRYWLKFRRAGGVIDIFVKSLC